MNNNDKVAIMPCAGIGQIFGQITREVGYNLVDDLYPENTVLVCPPALAVDIQEDIDFINEYPVLVLNGCKDRCATKLILQKGGQVEAEVYLPDILKKEKISLKDEKRGKLGEKSKLAIQKMTEDASMLVKNLLNR
ncbi:MULTISPECIES: putative zinc-binding protein [Thermoanaerobacterium]|uniref:DGC domain-containing protein n=2 Tax=Thermoanaerobacterium TaxID=28895 RepID=W9EBS2_9THEO|nr:MULTISPECIES: putative zinc-binding protein [Thermoanaerobacterium]AFK86551.1 DGC domain protein [Thermoanaerobacterium saccharolyticum JW/SL-YS485]ETO38435.1 DGC domain-containing protein [Thermoanaerobacterium aotearoense SCUT27]